MPFSHTVAQLVNVWLWHPLGIHKEPRQTIHAWKKDLGFCLGMSRWLMLWMPFVLASRGILWLLLMPLHVKVLKPWCQGNKRMGLCSCWFHPCVKVSWCS